MKFLWMVCLCLGASMACPSLALAQAVATSEAGVVRLANPHIAVQLDARTGTLRSVLDVAGAQELMSVPTGSYQALWGLSLGHHATPNAPYADNNAATLSEVKLLHSEQGAAVHLLWQGLRFFNSGLMLENATIAVQATLGNDDTVVRWRIAIDGLDGVHATDLHFPIIGGVGRLGGAGADNVLVVPEQGGRLIQDPIGKRSGYGHIYPSAHMSMQFTAFYNAGSGFYLGAHDTRGQTKQLLWWSPPTPADSAMWIGHHYFPDEPAQRLALEHDVAIGVFRGGWRGAADTYGRWARQQSWVREAMSKELPDWFRQSSYGSSYCVYGCGFAQSATYDSFIQHQSENFANLGGASLLFLMGWEKLGAWAYGDALPPSEGWSGFDRMVQAVKASGNRLRLCVGFNKLDSATPLWISGQADDSFVRDVRGQPVTTVTAIGSNVHTWYLMSAGSVFWRNELTRTVVELARHGVDAISLDGWPIWGVDDDYSGGHPKGRGGTWQWEQWQQTLIAVRSAAKAVNPDVIFSTEEGHELLLPYIDFFDKRDTSTEINEYSKQGQVVPLFASVYKPFYQAGPGDYWPWMRKEDPDTYHRLVIARALLWGEHAPFMYASFRNLDALAPGALKLYKTAGAMRRSYGRFLIDGSLLAPLAVQSPSMEVVLKGDGFAVPSFRGEAGTVQASAWRARGGEVGLFLVNLSDVAQSVLLPVAFDALGLMEGVSHTTALQVNNGPALASQLKSSSTLPVHLGPLQVAVLTIKPQTAQQECILDWVEAAYSSYLQPSRVPTQQAGSWLYRHYRDSQAYFGVAGYEDRVLYWGPLSNYQPLELGSMASLRSLAKCEAPFSSR
jgi:hypothetical protein